MFVGQNDLKILDVFSRELYDSCLSLEPPKKGPVVGCFFHQSSISLTIHPAGPVSAAFNHLVPEAEAILYARSALQDAASAGRARRAAGGKGGDGER